MSMSEEDRAGIMQTHNLHDKCSSVLRGKGLARFPRVIHVSNQGPITMYCRIFITLMMLVAANVADASGLPYHYVYVLREDHDAKVCRHMLGVFNRKFARLWDYPPADWTTNAALSKYVFPRLPGVHPGHESDEELWHSAFPTSAEFSAIQWKQGMAVPGGCPTGQTCSGQSPRPILVAHFDFDNDGSVDTVIKSGFLPAYNGMIMGLQYLEVWRGQMLTIAGTPSMWELEHPKDEKLVPIIMNGMYLRPFIYRHMTYVATYVRDFRKNAEHDQELGSPPYPIREDMLVNRYYFDGRKDQVGRPQWSAYTACDLQMKRLSDR